MHKKIFVSSLLLLLAIMPGFSRQIAGVDMQETYTLGSDSLVLNGAGIRNKFFVDAYVCGLYVKSKKGDAQAILSADEPMVFRIVVISGMITRDKFLDAVNEGFQKSTGGNTAPYQADINKFMGFFSAEIKKWHYFDLEYVPGKGIKAKINGTTVGSVGGLNFKKILFGIWIGNDPAEKKLKKGLLGG